MGLVPKFNQQAMTMALLNFAKENEAKFVNTLAFIGETFVNEARTKRTYQDITGNLRSSIGYAIVKNGRTVKFTAKESPEAGDLVTSIVSEGSSDSIYLIVFAGMEYAKSVEKNGYDVISGSRPSRNEVISMFKDLLDNE
jgi:hypothetical protein